MCDEQTEIENEAYLRRLRMRRRELGLGAGAAVVTLLGGCGPNTPTTTTPGSDTEPEPEPEVASVDGSAESMAPQGRMVTIDTPDGTAEGFFVAPGSDRYPAVLIWPDVAGLRGAFNEMATRLASEGYAVLAVNPYYRSSKMPVLETFEEWRTDEGRAKIKPMREALTAEAVGRDAAAFVAWLDAHEQVDSARKIGTTGYCMGGPFTFRTAAAAPQRVGLIGSFHGGGLVTEEPDSPHTLMQKMQAAALVCIAANDDERQPEAKTTLRETAESAGRPAEVEVYPAQHGWCVTDSPVYDAEQAERAWSRLLHMLGEHL